MKKFLKITAVLLVVAVAGIQFVRPNRANPGIDPKLTLESSENVPPEVASILKRSCNDCHSNSTVWPWYSNVAPISWSVAAHVNEGREELNFSVWNTYSVKRKAKKLEEMCEEVEERHMPHPQYLWIHREAVMTEADVKTLCDWTADVRKRIGSGKDSEEDRREGNKEK